MNVSQSFIVNAYYLALCSDMGMRIIPLRLIIWLGFF